MKLAPVALFVYNRPEHTRIVLEALCANELAAESELFVFADGPKTPQHAPAVDEVRRLVRQVQGLKAVHVVEREKNYGCARSISGGVTEIVNRFGRVIVVEDDTVVSPWFLRYMNEGLDMYADDEQVASIHGYLYPVDVPLPETFFIRGAEIWGWGTWKRAWDFYEFDAGKLLGELRAKGLTRVFNFDGSANFTGMLMAQAAGRIDTWDVQWHAVAVLRGMLTLYPGKSLVRNIGFDSSGTHNPTSRLFDVDISDMPVRLERIALVEDQQARAAIARFWRKVAPGFWKRLAIRALGLIRSRF